MLLTDSFLDYLLHERNYSKGTVEYYRADILELQRFGEEMLGDLTPSDVDAELVREWIASLMDKGLASNTINRKLSSIRTYYKFLLRRGEVAVDPLRKVTGPKKKKPLPVFLREGEMNRLLDDMDFGEGFEGCRDHMIIEMFYVPVRSDAFFVRKNGKRLYRSIVACLVKRNLSKVVTVKKRSPHVLRHTFATAMLNNGADLGSIKELLGHESLATTEVYTHTTFEELKKVYNQAHPRA